MERREQIGEIRGIHRIEGYGVGVRLFHARILCARTNSVMSPPTSMADPLESRAMRTDESAARWPLVGRSEELAFLARALGEGANGIVIAGEPGVGKSRLAADFVASVGDRPVVRVAASASLQAVPLGAFAPVLPPGLSRTPRQPAETLRLVADHLAAPAAAPPLVWIDDAQLLDELSAGLVLQLAVGRRAFVVATLRSGEESPDAVRRLWRDGHARRLEIQPLGVADTAELLARVLGAAVDAGTRERIWSASRGNLLYLRELVRIGVESGALARRGELWIWQGPLRVSQELRELIAERLAALDPESYAALETIALAEPLAPAVAEGLGLMPYLVSLDRAGFVRLDAQADPPVVRLVHPLFGEVVRASVTPLRTAAIERAHAVALVETGADLLRLAIAQMQGHVAADPTCLLAATTRARALADHALATRLARAAVGAGGGGRAMVALAECLFWEGRHEELIAWLADDPLANAAPADRIAAEIHRASSLYWGFGRDTEAIDVLRRASALAPHEPAAGEAAGQCAFVLTNAGRPREAIEVARGILDRPDSSSRARVYSFSAITIALAITGRFDAAHAEAQRGFPLAVQMREEMPITGGGIVLGSCVAWFLGGSFAALDQTVGALYQRSAEIGDPFLGLWAHMLARNALMRGRLAEAERFAAEAVALLRLHDPALALPWALAVLAQVEAQRGDAERAREVVRELDRQPRHMAICEADLELARAWSEAASGDLASARRRIAAIARAQCETGSEGLASCAIHELARLGGAADAVPLIEKLADRVDGPLVRAWSRQIQALAEHDATALEAAGGALEALDCLLDAAESYASAAAIHADAGRRDAASRAAARALELTAACGAPRTPALAAVQTDPVGSLTPREREIARLAASGVTRRAIAEDLGLSLRTVSNHLNHVYAKLGVADRASLAALLGATAAPQPAGRSAETG
jgi:DNA-binding NarL/FixJ family response regulator